MFNCVGEIKYKGAATPLMVTVTPPRFSGSGTADAASVAGERFCPNTLRIIPGATFLPKDAPFATAAITTSEDAPIVNVTGTLTNCGMVFTDWKTRVAV